MHTGIGYNKFICSTKVKKFMVWEILEAAVLDARENAENNNITNAEFY